ncbi:MAG: hypothetical protein EOO00_10245 [Chitinophagaceae bacterium]|nr:MAG: hypothetical protein EOO00_10245 [Chitinophagaceae bacterium]
MMVQATNSSYAQDGSDMIRVSVDSAQNYINRPVHLDFGRKSRRNYNIDTFAISVNRTDIRLVEVIGGNHLNHWFFQQWLQSIDSIESVHLRLIQSTITSVTDDSIRVVNYFNFYDKAGVPLLPQPFQDAKSFSKGFVAQIHVYTGKLLTMEVFSKRVILPIENNCWY